MTETDPRLLKAFPKPPMVCLKRGPNLKDKLIKARLPPKQGMNVTRAGTGQRLGFRCCKAGRRAWSLCPFTGAAADRKTVMKEVTIKHSGLKLPILQQISCRDDFCLYVLSCTKTGCMKQYVGQSSRPVYLQFDEHLGTISDPTTTCSVGRHWQQPGHTLEHLEFQAVERLGTRCRATLREREKMLIARTGVLSEGLNINL